MLLLILQVSRSRADPHSLCEYQQHTLLSLIRRDRALSSGARRFTEAVGTTYGEHRSRLGPAQGVSSLNHVQLEEIRSMGPGTTTSR